MGGIEPSLQVRGRPELNASPKLHFTTSSRGGPLKDTLALYSCASACCGNFGKSSNLPPHGVFPISLSISARFKRDHFNPFGDKRKKRTREERPSTETLLERKG